MNKIITFLLIVLLVVSIVAVGASAAEVTDSEKLGIPPIDDIVSQFEGVYDNVAIIQKMEGGYTLYLSADPFSYDVTDESAGMWILYTGSGYAYADLVGGVWSEPINMPGSSVDMMNGMPVYANYDIGDIYTPKDGFFPSPALPTPVPDVDIAEHTTNVLPTILNALGVLVAVGIGIMACFIGVKLIPRLIHKFF